MKSTLLRTFFEWALITSVLMSVGFFAWYYFKSGDVRTCNTQMASAQLAFQNNRTVMAVLLNECREYAKTNADMARLLSSGNQPAAAAPAMSAPASRPKAK